MRQIAGWANDARVAGQCSISRQDRRPRYSLSTARARLPALDDHTSGRRLAARRAVYRHDSGRGRWVRRNRRRVGCGVWVGIADETTISKSGTPKSPLAGKGPMVKASAMNTFAMNASAAKAAATTTAAIRCFSGDWLGQCQNGRERCNGNTQAACDADRFQCGLLTVAAGVAADEGVI